jgi:DNA-directed RNA polymerase beta' subunit
MIPLEKRECESILANKNVYFLPLSHSNEYVRAGIEQNFGFKYLNPDEPNYIVDRKIDYKCYCNSIFCPTKRKGICKFNPEYPKNSINLKKSNDRNKILKEIQKCKDELKKLEKPSWLKTSIISILPNTFKHSVESDLKHQIYNLNSQLNTINNY